MKAVARESSQLTEEEALKRRNTDCVYFLASPLTCKKGSECEYRHSEDARMNPRDCYFWLNGSCLNPKCPFRHPPLDGLVGTPGATSAKPSLPASLPGASAQLTSANMSVHNPVKQNTLCYYFQKGQCLKGDRCAFMHGPQPVDRVASQPPAPKISPSVTEPQTVRKPQTLWIPEKFNQPRNVPQENVVKPFGVPATVKPPVKSVTAPFENGFAAEKGMSRMPLDNEVLRNKTAYVPSSVSGNSVSRIHRGHQAQALDDRHFRNSKDPEEFLGESPPGFDVLVDDELLESDYYEKEDDFGRMTDHDGRFLNTMNEIDYGRSGDRNAVAKYDREIYNDSHGYDTHGRTEDRYAREQRKVSSERISDRAYVSERRGLPRVESPEPNNELDLRYRLSKQRRTSSSRSAVSPDSRSDYRRDVRVRNVEDQRYQGHTRRESPYLHPESSRSSRLQGRISIPGRSSPDRNRTDSRSDKEIDRGRKRLSPGRPPVLPFTGRPQDRIRRNVEDEFNTEGRSFRAPFIRKDEPDNTLNFAGPKRLVELKKGVKSERNEQQQTRGLDMPLGDGKNPKIRKFDMYQEENSSSFEGPKPLTEILKRKRQEKTVVSEDGSKEGDYQKEENLLKQTDISSDTKDEDNDKDSSAKEEKRLTNTENSNGAVHEEEEEEGLIAEEVEDQPSAQKRGEHETEDAMAVDNAEDEEFEKYDERDHESDYEQVEDDGNQEPEEEYYDDEDEEGEGEGEGEGDDFAKRIGVMFS